MISKKDLVNFTQHCEKHYGIKIDDNVIEDFIQFVNTRESYYHKAVSTPNTADDCEFNALGCAHINFNTIKCESCIN